jgi:CRP-like cAMP-binding protein
MDVLRRVPLFAGFEPADLELLAGVARRVVFPRASIVFQEGDAGDFLLVVTKGRVKVTLLGDDGGETILGLLEPPAFLGEIALLDESPRSSRSNRPSSFRSHASRFSVWSSGTPHLRSG